MRWHLFHFYSYFRTGLDISRVVTDVIAVETMKLRLSIKSTNVNSRPWSYVKSWSLASGQRNFCRK